MFNILNITPAEFSLHPFSLIGLDFYTLTCVMIVYAFIGWFYESTVFSLCEQGKFMNRGCFIGPYLPIYAVVSVFTLYLLSDVTSSFKLVILSSIIVCTIEYITSWALEKLFHARYWDYSYYPLNINGRISVISGLFFGFAMLFLVKVLHPFTLRHVLKIPFRARKYGSIAFWCVFIFDAIFTTIAMCNLNKKCKQLYDAWDNFVEGKLEVLNEKKEALDRFTVVRKGKELVVKAKGVNTKFVELETRYLKSKGFKSTRYGKVVDKLKNSVMNIKDRKMLSYDELPEELIHEFENEDSTNC